MASVQDIDTRLRVIEDKIHFIMENIRGRIAVKSSIVSPDGHEMPPKLYDASMDEIYKIQRQLPDAKMIEEI